MRKIFKYLLRTILVLTVIAGGFALFIHFRGIPYYSVEKIDFQHKTSPEIVLRGQKLATMLCAGCHLNNDTGVLSGKRMLDAPPEFGIVNSANITSDDQYGIGKYTDGELKYLLRTGIKKNGQYSPPYMAKVPHMADEDINAIIAFLRSEDRMVQPTKEPTKPCEPSFLTKFLCFVEFEPLPLPKKIIPMPDTTNEVELGKYLAHNLDCFTCHSADFTKLNILEPEKSAGYFGGGNKPLNMEGKVMVTPNLTFDKATGIGSWSKEKFVQAVRSGIVEGQPALRYPMNPYPMLTDYEAGAIYEFLKTVPKIKNKVTRSK
ncbi:MAG: cytochrome c [Bacteroidetes bacterium]|nr:MAG: cytochrome c [Bacteroidota bacterium]